MPVIRRTTTKSGDPRWRVQYRAGGRGSPHHGKTFASEAGAVRYSGLVDAVGWQEAERILTVPQVAAERTVAQQVAHHIEHLTNVTIGTRSDYQSHATDIDHYLGAVPLPALTRDQVIRFVMALRTERGLSHKSIKHRHSLLSASLKAAMRSDLLTRNVAEGVDLPRDDLTQTHEMVTLTVPEVQRLLDLTPDHWRPFIATLVGTGMRVGEATALQVGDIDLAGQRATIRRAWKHTDGHGSLLGLPKSRKSRRTLYLGTVAHLLAPLLEGRPADAWVFTNTRGNVVRRNAFYDGPWTALVHEFAGDTATVAKTATIAKDGKPRRAVTWTPGPGKRPRIHDLRHTYATIKLREGKSLAWLQVQLGHESIDTTTNTYGHLQDADLAALGDVITWPDVRAALGAPTTRA